MKETNGVIKEKIILDTDIGCDMDDMLALAYLLLQEKAELLGITTVTGEPVTRAKLAKIMCSLAERDIPVHVGAGEALCGKFRQNTLVGSEKALVEEISCSDDFEENTAIEFLREIIEQHPGEITLCAIGPLTNIAILFEKYPHIPSLLGKLVIMGGRFGDVDTARWGAQEWNIINDPAAAKAVFDAPVKDVRVFGVEQTCRVFVTDTKELADRCESVPCLLPFSHVVRTWHGIWYHDAVAVSALFYDDGMTFKRGHISVSANGDTSFTSDKNGNHLLLTDMDIDKFFEHFNKTVCI